MVIRSSIELKIKKIEIFNLTGKKVFESFDNTGELNVENLNPGIYILNLTNIENQVVSKKFIRNNEL